MMKQDGGDQDSEGGQAVADIAPVANYFFTGVLFLNIDSMRCVTMKPPKILTAAQRHGDEAEAAARS